MKHNGAGRTAFLRDPVKLFLILSAICLAVLFVALPATNGQAFGLFFFTDTSSPDLDTGMDFFNSYAETAGGCADGCGKLFVIAESHHDRNTHGTDRCGGCRARAAYYHDGDYMQEDSYCAYGRGL